LDECGGEGSCNVLAQSFVLDDRLLAIEGLVTEVRACLLDNCGEVMAGVSLTAALDAARLLARSITREADADLPVGHAAGEERLRWIVLYPERAEPSPPAVLPLRRRRR
jgi:hypothetical protein